MLAFKAVSHRLIFWILGASTLVFLASSYYDYRITQSLLNQQIQSKVKLAKSLRINRVESLLQGARGSVRTAAEILEIAQPNDGRIDQLLKRIVASHDDIYGMTIALEPRQGGLEFAPYYYHDGEAMRYADLSAMEYNYRGQSWYTEAIASGRGRWSEPYFDAYGGEVAMVTYTQPIYIKHKADREQAADRTMPVGVITADITLDMLQQVVNERGAGERSFEGSGFAYIFTHQGNIITHSRPERVMSNIGDGGGSVNQYRENREIIVDMLAGGSDTRNIPCRSAAQGDRCWLSYQPITGVDWSVAVIIPMEELTADVVDYQRMTLIITLVGLLVLAVIVVLISRRLSVPLLSLAHSSRALAAGDLDTAIDDYHLQDEVGTLARQFQSMQGSLKQYIADLEQATNLRQRLEGELGAAHDIQMQMLPDRGCSDIDSEHWQLQARMEPAKSVGGDLYHYQSLSTSRLFFALGDVSDKGVAAALFMAKTQTLLRQLCGALNCGGAPLTELLAALMTELNVQLCQDNDSCMFVTLICGVLDIHSGELTLISAGHHGPVLLTDRYSLLEVEAGPALGFYEDAEFEAMVTELPPAASLLLSSDGVEEAADPNYQLFGEQRLEQVLSRGLGQPQPGYLGLLLAAIEKFRSGAEPNDDMTVMLLTRR